MIVHILVVLMLLSIPPFLIPPPGVFCSIKREGPWFDNGEILIDSFL